MYKAVLVVALAAACDVGDATGGMSGSDGTDGGQNGTGNGGGGGSGNGSGTGGGMLGNTALRVTFTSSPTGTGLYAPSNVVAVWVLNADNQIMKTIGRWAEIRKQHLVAWTQSAGTNDVDAISGATRLGHTGALSVTWDLKNRQGTVIPDGTYTVRLESTDLNATAANQNNQGTFTFVKGAQPQTQTGLSNGGFTNVSIELNP